MKTTSSFSSPARWVLFLGVFLVVSCNKWIDVHTPEQMTLKESLQRKQGFLKILAGIYAKMGEASLYGRELEFGMMDVLSGYWDINQNHQYNSDYHFSYQNSGTRLRIYRIWSDMYMLIRQCNVLLENVDRIKSDPDYELLKGEIIGLRAFFHFELFRLFGPVLGQKHDVGNTIPYYFDTKIQKPEKLRYDEYMAHLQSDLLSAIVLLHKDPILKPPLDGTEGGIEPADDFLKDRRKQHFNLYAAKALLARSYSWQGNVLKAAHLAQELIEELKDERTVRFISMSDRYGDPPDKDIRLNMESIWGLQVKQMNEMTRGYLYDITHPEMQLKTAYEPVLKDLFEGSTGSTNDIRFRWWRPNKDFYKLFDLSLASSNVAADKYQIAQLVSLPELHFLACEGFAQSDPQLALQHLNMVRQSRNIFPIEWSQTMSGSTIKVQLLEEIRREYIGEGVLFLYYKKWFNPIYRADGIMAPSINKFVWPVPVEENV
ncbi:MAG: RagB/SusD family nutrient uptake outer membrane protein [Sphingobacterium hotanense]